MPGRIETERVRHLDSRRASLRARPSVLQDDPAGARRESEQSIPLRRYGQPAETGRIAAFVLSPAASNLIGCVLPVEGGALRAL